MTGRSGVPGRERAIELGYVAGWKLVRLLPAGLARVLFDAGADLAVRRGGRGPRQLARNLRRVVGPVPPAELDALVRAGMRSYARYWREAFRLPGVPADRLCRSFHMETPELFARACADGAVLALPHMANWELAGVWAVAQGARLISVAQRLSPEGLFQRFLAYRQALGMEIIPHARGERPPIDVLAEKLAAGYLVALVADRDMSARGVPVRFFGGPARMPAGPALLALRTGRPLFGVTLWYEPDGTHCRMVGPLAPGVEGDATGRVADLTQQLADVFAAGIAAHPADWHMLARLWLDDTADRTDHPDPAGSGARPVAGTAGTDRAG